MKTKKKGIQNFRQKRQSKITVFHFYKKCKKNCGKLNKKMEAATKKFWKMMKSFFPDRIISKKTNLISKTKETVSENSNVAQTMNTFFWNIVTNLKFPKYIDNSSIYMEMLLIQLQS